MQDGRTVTIALSNETTASQVFYEVSQEVAGLLMSLSEEEIAKYMPRQRPDGLGYEAVAYADGLVKLARHHGIADRDIIVRIAAIPEFLFETGWAVDNPESPLADNATDLLEHVEAEGTDTFTAAMTQDEIRTLLDRATFVDAQCEDIDGVNRFVSIVLDDGRYLAVVPTVATANSPRDEKQWEQPYEVKRMARKIIVNSWRWVPIDEEGVLPDYVADDVRS